MTSTKKRNHQADIDTETEATIRRTSSIGDLERLAGISQDHESRYQFWHLFAALPADKCLDAGVAELKRRIWMQRT